MTFTDVHRVTLEIMAGFESSTQREAIIAALAEISQHLWRSVSDELPKPGAQVIAFFKNDHGKGRTICAQYVTAMMLPLDPECDPSFWKGCGFNEETEEWFAPAGWYEWNECGDEERQCNFVHGTITHWMPLPEAPIA